MTRYEDFQIDVRINLKIFARMFFFFILLIIRHHPCKSVLFVDDATLWFWLLLPCLREENSIHWIKLESGLLTSLHKNVWYFIDRIHCLPWEYRNWILFRCLLVSLTFLVPYSCGGNLNILYYYIQLRWRIILRKFFGIFHGKNTGIFRYNFLDNTIITEIMSEE